MSEQLQEDLVDFLNAIEAACVNLKHRIARVHGVVSERAFLNLVGWEKSQGNKIGEFSFTTRKANNNSDAFNHALNILKTNNATISSRFHDKGFQHSYWLYEAKPETIYRQILKSK